MSETIADLLGTTRHCTCVSIAPSGYWACVACRPLTDLLALCRCVVCLSDPHLEKAGWPVIENRLPYVPLHLGLTILGYTVQKR